MHNNQGQQQNSANDGIGATLQVATVITTSDQLIAENIEGTSLFSEPEELVIDVSRAALIESSSGDDSSDVEDTVSANQSGLASLSNTSLAAVAGVVSPAALSAGSLQINLERAVSGGPATSGSAQILETDSQTAAEDDAEELIEDDEADQESQETIEYESSESTQQEMAESVVEPIEDLFATDATDDIAALDALNEEVAKDAPVIEVPIPDIVDIGFNVSDGSLESQEYTQTVSVIPVVDAPVLSAGASSQLFITNFQEGVEGWQTENPSGYLELNPETPYGGHHASNRVIEVEAAYGDDSLYRMVPTEAGTSYQLNFQFSPRQGVPDSTIEVLWDGNVITTLDGSSGKFGWEDHSLVLLGDGSDKRLEFNATDHNGVGGLLDNIELVELYAKGLEDQPVFVGMRASLMDTDGSTLASISSSQLVIRDDYQVAVTLEGRILSENDFSSIEHWHLDHNGGPARYCS